MADFDSEQPVVTPTTLQSGILAIADSLKVWTAILPFPGWISNEGDSSRQDVLFPIVDLFAYTDPKYKKFKIYFDPTFYLPSNDRGFEDLKIKLLSTCHTNGSCMTYRGGRVKMSATVDTATSLPTPTTTTRTKKKKTAPKYRFACNRGRVFRPETRPQKLSKTTQAQETRTYTVHVSIPTMVDAEPRCLYRCTIKP
jgi:hypothetical protein